jgi:hypothetical protein
MKRTFLLSLLMAISWSSVADDRPRVFAGYDPAVDIIADNYEAGRYLIYDCVEGHWTCVTGPYYVECEKKRGLEIEEKKIRASCAAISIFPTKKSCFQKQLFLVSKNHAHNFCTLAGWKQKEIEFHFQK